jgi:hypothetical protein
MSDETTTRSRNGLRFALALLLGLMVYPLSMGPAHYFIRRTGKWVRLYVRAYTPVIWLHDNTLLAEPLEGYIRWWGSLVD